VLLQAESGDKRRLTCPTFRSVRHGEGRKPFSESLTLPKRGVCSSEPISSGDTPEGGDENDYSRLQGISKA
jgi:hypothetical protein